MEDVKFADLIDFDEVVQCIHKEAQYAAGILTFCDACVISECKKDTVFIVTVKFSRFNIEVSFQIELDLHGTYYREDIKSKLEKCCKSAVSIIAKKSYRNERIIERSEESE